GSSLSTTDATPALGQRPHYLFSLLPRVFLSNSVFVISRKDIFCNDLSVFLDDTRYGYVRGCLSKLSHRSLKRVATRHDYCALNEIFKFTNVPRPFPVR